jgi:hypothetical protein
LAARIQAFAAKDRISGSLGETAAAALADEPALEYRAPASERLPRRASKSPWSSDVTADKRNAAASRGRPDATRCHNLSERS